MNTVLHKASQQFVNSLKEGDVVVLENLGIGERARCRKSQRADFHSWAFRRLQSYIEYKALERGIPVIYVDVCNSSKTLPRCVFVSDANGKGVLFRCERCGFQHNADWVACLNLARRAGSPATGRPVNRPHAGLSAMSFEHHDHLQTPSLGGVVDLLTSRRQ